MSKSKLIKMRTILLQISILLFAYSFTSCNIPAIIEDNLNGKDPAGNGTVTTYQLTLTTASGGSGSIDNAGSTTNGSYSAKLEVIARAKAAPGYTFAGWYDKAQDGNLVSTDNPYKFKLTSDTSLFAVFSKTSVAKYDLQLQVDPKSSGTGSIDQDLSTPNGSHPAGTQIRIKAVPGDNSTFEGWFSDNGTLVTRDKIYFFMIQKDTKLLARFKMKPVTMYNLQLEVDTQSSGTGSIDQDLSTPNGSHPAGTQIRIKAVPGDNSTFEGWFNENGTLVTKGKIYFFMIQKDTKLFARFKKKLFPDPALEKIIRAKLNKPTGAITKEDVAGLSTLRARGNGNGKITNLTGMEHLKSLYILELGNHQISDLTPLTTLTNLEQLQLDYNSISNLTPLSNLKKLKLLNLGQNRISNIAAITKLPNLNNLQLFNNNISTIPNLREVSRLEYLNLFGNKLNDNSNLSNLNDLIGLESLQLNSNNISDISSIKTCLVSTKVIYLQSNSIKDISVFKDARFLYYLDLSNNGITDIQPLIDNKGQSFEVNLKGNNISQSQIDTLKNIPNRVVDF